MDIAGFSETLKIDWADDADQDGAPLRLRRIGGHREVGDPHVTELLDSGLGLGDLHILLLIRPVFNFFNSF